MTGNSSSILAICLSRGSRTDTASPLLEMSSPSLYLDTFIVWLVFVITLLSETLTSHSLCSHFREITIREERQSDFLEVSITNSFLNLFDQNIVIAIIVFKIVWENVCVCVCVCVFENSSYLIIQVSVSM